MSAALASPRMAEPAYPVLEDVDEPKIGFEGLTDDVKRERIDDKRIKSSEEIELIDSKVVLL